MALKLVNDIDLDFVLVAEDVRQERHNKWSVLGIFHDEIIVAALPAALRLAVYAQGHSKIDYDGPLSVRFLMDQRELIKAQGNYVCKAGPVTFAIGGFQLGLSSAGTITIEVSEDNTNWRLLESVRLVVGPLPA